MTTYRRPPASNEPLTPDERAWAERLARIGPHDGPSMALDTRILAAARAAVAQRPLDQPWRRRWPRLVGIVYRGDFARTDLDLLQKKRCLPRFGRYPAFAWNIRFVTNGQKFY